MVKQLSKYLIALAAGLGAASSAQAATFTATELSYDHALLSSFNLINLGDYKTSSLTEGRVLVGGGATATGSASLGCASHGCTVGNSTLAASSNTSNGGVASVPTNTSPSPNQGYGALTVFGNLTGGFNVQSGGDINVLGNVSGSSYSLHDAGGFNLGGTSVSGTTVNNPTELRTTQSAPPGTLNPSADTSYQPGLALSSVFPFGTSATANFTTPLTNLSQGIANLPGTPGVNAQTLPSNQTSVFVAGADFTGANGLKYGVVTTTLAGLVAEGTSFGGVSNGSTNAATFVIVTGSTANAVLPTLNYADAKVIYDFVSATSLAIGGNFNGSILAPLATISYQSGTINGSVVVASINQTNELHQGNLFTGDLSGLKPSTARVPEPASLALIVVGLGAAAIARRRGRRSLVVTAATITGAAVTAAS